MVTEIVAALAILAVMGLYLFWLATRLDRLHARVDAAGSALNAQLARRSSTAMAFSRAAPLPPETAQLLQRAARSASETPGLGHDRETVENALTRALMGAVAASPTVFTERSEALTDMHDEALRASIARGFFNDAVRDALVIRDRRIVRWLGLAGHAPHPTYFEMDDEELPTPGISVAAGPTIEV